MPEGSRKTVVALDDSLAFPGKIYANSGDGDHRVKVLFFPPPFLDVSFYLGHVTLKS